MGSCHGGGTLTKPVCHTLCYVQTCVYYKHFFLIQLKIYQFIFIDKGIATCPPKQYEKRTYNVLNTIENILMRKKENFLY